MEGKFALVTGGSRGIGREVCLELAEMGFDILVNFQGNAVEAGKTVAMVKEKGRQAEALQFNVADGPEVETKLNAWKAANPKATIEVLVNNAGIRKDNLFFWMSDEEWNTVLDVSLKGFYNVTKYIVKDMLSMKRGNIVNVVSLSGIKGMPGQVNYSAAKGAVIAATKSLAQEVGRRGIRVNAVAPGFIVTDMTENINEAEFKKMIPLNRFGEAKEVSSVVGFLVSPKSAYITGEVIAINGGLYT
ncbi:MAG TPA: 3-oxoacyl-ACP reductase FabG [Cytophagaceae bacterium]|jgi:3-oxoacyl-[acyl-carrier protein] reductase|nr:3-oxoacyl-ACP reductase FabG [Cytophagaceae bacterium]